MGKALINCLARESVPGLDLVGAVDLASAYGQGTDVGPLSGAGETGVMLSADLPALTSSTDVFIDFSFHEGIEKRGQVIANAGKAWVIGTTGLTDEEKNAVAVIAKGIPVVLAPNMSLGVNLIHSLVKQAAAALADKGYDIEITEMHHRKKLDAPSGTALYLGEAAAEGAGWDLSEVSQHGREGISEGERPEKEIGFHSLRGGDVVGDHEVLLAAEGELVRIGHRATNRDTFALGALRAAQWLAGKPAGLYTMRDVLGLN